MSYCFNPYCHQPENRLQDICQGCGANLLLKQRYQGVKSLGKSQLASTIEVKDLRQQPASSKVIKILLTDYYKAVSLFQQEAEILSQVNHPGIPKIAAEGYFSWQPQWSKHPIHCLVIEKIAGLDLAQWLAQRDHQPLTVEKAYDWLEQLLSILQQLHQQQYFHRDIKPANIILQPNGRLALVDFGAARKVSSTYLGKIGVNQGVTSIGTPGYIAPEQIDGRALPQSDFFALGRTFVHLLTGKHPQELPKDSDTGKIIWHEHLSERSPSLAELIDSMMEHLPSKRPPTITAIRDRLSIAKQFPDRTYSRRRLNLSLPIVFSACLLPLAVLGIVNIQENISQRVTAKQIANIPLCNNLSCVNRDPIDNKCDEDAQTITSNIGNYRLGQDLKAYRLEIRHSPRCEAVWARSEAPYRSSHYIEDSQGKKYGQVDVVKDRWDRHYADMAPGKNIRVRACAKPPASAKSCTNFVQP